MQMYENTGSPYGELTQNDIMNNNNIPVDQDIRRSFLADNDAYAADLNKLIAKKASIHAQPLFATFVLIIGISVVVSLSVVGTIQISVGGLVGICVGIYLLYLLIGFICNPLFSYLDNIEHGANFENQYNRIRSIQGYFSFYAECYHYQTRHHTRTVTDNNGNTRTQHYTTQQKVITHTATEILSPRSCEDDSGHIEQVTASKEIIFVHNKVNYRFKDQYSRNIFQNQWLMFQNRHRRDVHQNYTQNFMVPGLKSRMCFYVGQRPRNYICFFIFWSLFGFMWPYAMFIQKKVCRYDIQYMKIVAL